ncbi:MAG: hypothetical protein WCA06_18940 [Terrimicrobiaceae bacterium]
MLQIREEQMAVFEQAALKRFENEMVVHSTNFAPHLCEVIGEEQLRLAICRAMARAGGYGFTNRGPIRLFIELMFLFGSAFDTDPQYPWAGDILHASDDQMQRAEQLREKTLDYQEKVSGPDGVNTRKALEGLSVLARQPTVIASREFLRDALQEVSRVFPQKAAYVGEAALKTLVNEASTTARNYGLPVRGEGLFVALMFAFGHGCSEDPLYPWIARTLNDRRIVEPSARADRLRKKAVTWLDHVLARPRAVAQG